MSNLIVESGADPIGVAQARPESVIEQSRAAWRASFSPIEWKSQGEILGFYSTSQVSGAVASLAAGGNIAGIRWTDLNHQLLLTRIQVGAAVASVATTATVLDVQATIVRGFTQTFGSFNTNLSMAAVQNTNKYRVNFGQSLLGVNGPQICTTGALAGGSLTADTAPFAMAPFTNLVAVKTDGTAVLLPVGAVAAPMEDLYKWDKLGAHPIVLGSGEGVVIQNVTAIPITGATKYYVRWEWAEVKGF